MKSDKSSSKPLFVRILRTFLLYSFAILLILWLLEIVGMKGLYRMVRVRELKEATNELAEDFYDVDDLKEKLTEMASKKDICTVIINTADNRKITTNEMVLRMLLGNDYIQKLSIIDGYYYSQGSSVLYICSDDPENSFNRETVISDSPKDMVVGIINIQHVAVEGTDYLLIVIGEITPMESTVSTIRSIFLIVSLILLLFSVIISLIVARSISSPIATLNKEARKLGEGDYDAYFHGSGYREVEELSDTLNETAVQLKKADQITKDLIANVSHDLRTPLTMISGYGEIIRDVPGENTPENVQVIIDEANRLTSLVNNLLDISKLQSGTIGINPSIINLNELMAKTIRSYSTMMEKKGYNFNLDIDNRTIYVNADSLHIEQVLHNLINNAITHIGKDGTINIACHEDSHGKVRIDIIDHGSGIDEKDIPFIWQRYYKADKSHIRPETGSGLGLSIVKTILDLHKAEYGVISKVGEGSDFWFNLPVVESED